MEMQWRQEFASAQRKFQLREEQIQEKRAKKGRKPLGELKISVLPKVVDLTNIARKVATTREGRRVHNKATNEVVNKKASNGDQEVFFPVFGFAFLLFFTFIYTCL